MKAIMTSLLSGSLLCCLVGVALAQTDAPYGAPSMLPAQYVQPTLQGQPYSYQTYPSYQTVAYPATMAFGDPAGAAQLPPRTSRVVPKTQPSNAVPEKLPPNKLPAAKLPQNKLPRNAVPPVVPRNGSYTPGAYSGGTAYENGWGADCCEQPVCCEPVCGPRWYVGARGLVFTRNRPKFSQLSFDDTNIVGDVLNTGTGLGHWDGGVQLNLGWYMTSNWALDFTYWGIYGGNEQATVYAADMPGNLNSAIDFSPLNIGATNVNSLFDGAAAHRLQRHYDLNDFELNFIRGSVSCCDCSNLQISYLAGVRYVQFTEDFQYASADVDPVFGNNPNDEAFYGIDVQNDLWGFQLGGRADWCFTPRFSIYAGTKFGIYGNHMTQHSRIYNVSGTATVGPGNPLDGSAFDIKSSKDIASFVGEADLGLSFRFAQHWRAMIGYRAVAISGLAYATDQIPQSVADLPGVYDVDSNANMILHGGYAGVAFEW